MISCLILVERGAEALLVTLSALVQGVAAGVIADAVVIVRSPDQEIADVAEAAGAVLVVVSPGADPWRAGAAAARRDWLLCLADGDVPAGDWMGTLARFVLAGRPRRGRLRRPRSWAEIVMEAFAPRAIRAGDLVPRAVFGEPSSRLRTVSLSVAIERAAEG